MSNYILELKNITKEYPGVTALDNVSLGFQKGEVHAIVGENGAGKSTFIKIITGAISPTKGDICFEGQKVCYRSPQDALQMGITAIYQELNLIPYLSVAENIYYNRYPLKHGFIDYDAMEREAKAVLDRLGVAISPKTLVKDLSVGYQQLVEIAKSISQKAKVIIMDEPSAPLTNNELKYLFDIVRTLQKEGISIIYISHRLEEIFELCNRVSVFRDGHYICTKDIKDVSKDELIRLMVDRELSDTYPRIKLEKKEKVLEVKNLTTDLLQNVSFSAYKGERLGFAGLVGAGRTEIMRAIYGADKRKSGDIYLNGEKLQIRSPEDAIKAGLVLIPEDRKRQGVFLHMSIMDNIMFSYAKKIANPLGIIPLQQAKKACDEQIEKLMIKTPSRDQLVGNLSGGNQQKVILAKWLLMDFEVIILDEPTRGIDIGAKQEIYGLINDLALMGKTVIIISSEMPELIGMSDRILVMSEGRLTGEISAGEASQEKILKMASDSAGKGEQDKNE